MVEQVTPNEVEAPDSEREDSSPFPWPVFDDDVLAHVSERRKKAEKALSEWYEEARTDFEFAEGKQYSDEDLAQLERDKRVAAVFNRCAPIVNSILGQEVTNRQEVRYLPRKIGEVNAADSMNDAVKWVRETANAEDEDSDAFSDMVTCGMGWTVTRMDYEKNSEGMPEVQRRDPMLMRWDTSARRKNLADARWVQADYWMDKDAIEERWPEAELDDLVNLDTSGQRKEPHDSTEAWKYKNDAAGLDSYNDELRVIHHVEFFGVTRYRMVDPLTGEGKEYSEEEYENIKANAEAIGMPVPPCAKIKSRVFWHAWTCGSTMLEAGEAAAQKDFPYQAMTCYRQRETGYWYGVVRMMRDPQRYANRIMSLMMSILGTGAKGGLFYETGAFANKKKAVDEYGRADSMIELTPGAIAAQKIQPKPQQGMPPGAAELMQFAITSIRDVTGVNIDMLGGADRDQPGIVEDMRTKAGLTILAKVFDAMRLYRKRQGVLLAEFVERFISDGRLVRIVGKTGEQFIPLIRQDALEYDVVVDESPASRDVKERSWMALQVMIPGMMQAGMPVPPTVLDYAPIPQSLAMEWKALIHQAEQQGPRPSPQVQAEQIKAQARQQEAQAKMQFDAQVAQMKAQQDQQLQFLKMQASQATEEAQMRADIMVEKYRLQMQMQVDTLKMQHEAQMSAITEGQKQQTNLLQAIIGAIAKVETARVTAGLSSGDELSRAEGYPQ